MSEASVRGVIFAHGRMAEGLADAVHRISGVGDVLTAISNDGKGPEAMKADLVQAIGDGPSIVFTDMASGSCSMTALVSCRDRGQIAVICGVNLPVLLDFAFHRTLPLDELVPRLVEKGRESLRSLP